MAIIFDYILGKLRIKDPTTAPPVLITTSEIITTITTAGNWNVDGNYTGSTTGLVAGNYYYDDNWNLKYMYDGTTLRRFTYNEAI